MSVAIFLLILISPLYKNWIYYKDRPFHTMEFRFYSSLVCVTSTIDIKTATTLSS